MPVISASPEVETVSTSRMHSLNRITLIIGVRRVCSREHKMRQKAPPRPFKAVQKHVACHNSSPEADTHTHPGRHALSGCRHLLHGHTVADDVELHAGLLRQLHSLTHGLTEQ